MFVSVSFPYFFSLSIIDSNLVNSRQCSQLRHPCSPGQQTAAELVSACCDDLQCGLGQHKQHFCFQNTSSKYDLLYKIFEIKEFSSVSLTYGIQYYDCLPFNYYQNIQIRHIINYCFFYSFWIRQTN